MRKRSRLLLVILGVLLTAGLATSVLSAWQLAAWGDAGAWWGLGLNLGTELVGAVVIYVLLERVLEPTEEREKLKRRLIQELGSRVNDVAIAAAEKLRSKGWLTDGSLRKANLAGAELMEADLRGANLEEAHLQAANLRDADLRGADLREVRLDDAVLEEAHLESAKMRSACLESAKMCSAKLRSTDLRDADLRDADLRDAYLIGAKLTGATYDDNTRWPQDFTPPEDAINVDEQARQHVKGKES